MTKVFGIGFHKTGTTTLGVCLRRLGYKHQGFNRRLLRQVVQGDFEPAIDKARQFDSFDDWPWPLLYPQLDEVFPDSKFILTVRKNSDVWINSLLNHVDRRGVSDVHKLVYGLPQPNGYEQAFIERYESHNQSVLSYFAQRPEQLEVICWENGDGWIELCSFLNLPVPDEPLPYANKKPETLREWQQWYWPRLRQKLKRPVNQFKRRVLASKLGQLKR